MEGGVVACMSPRPQLGSFNNDDGNGDDGALKKLN